MPTTRARRTARVRDAIAAGGVVLRGSGDAVEVVIAGRDSDRTWVFPKGTPDHGETIEQTALREVREESGWVMLEVADDGPGLYPAEAEKVFERFYRSDPSRNRNQGGSGLGLSIVAAVAESHGGRARIESTPGQGATFRIELPLRIAQALVRVEEREHPQTPRPGTPIAVPIADSLPRVAGRLTVLSSAS